MNTDSDTGSRVYIEMGPGLTLHLMKPVRSSKSFFPLYNHHISAFSLATVSNPVKLFFPNHLHMEINKTIIYLQGDTGLKNRLNAEEKKHHTLE